MTSLPTGVKSGVLPPPATTPMLPHNARRAVQSIVGVRWGQTNGHAAHTRGCGLHNAVGAVVLLDDPFFGIPGKRQLVDLCACLGGDLGSLGAGLARLVGKHECNKHTGCRSRSTQWHGAPLCVCACARVWWVAARPESKPVKTLIPRLLALKGFAL